MYFKYIYLKVFYKYIYIFKYLIKKPAIALLVY